MESKTRTEFIELSKEDFEKVLNADRIIFCEQGTVYSTTFYVYDGDDIGVDAKRSAWIPADKIPPKTGVYMVTVQNLTGRHILPRSVLEAMFTHDLYKESGEWLIPKWEDNKVIAWQPLPEPYKGEQT